MDMNGNHTSCSSIQAAVSLSLLLLRRLPPRLTTLAPASPDARRGSGQDVAAGRRNNTLSPTKILYKYLF